MICLSLEVAEFGVNVRNISLELTIIPTQIKETYYVASRSVVTIFRM